jgi:hypothetical protein
MENGYAKWAANHATGMAAARAKTEAARLRGPALAERRRWARERHPCKVKGCKRTAYKGAICRSHWAMIPVRAKVDLVIATMEAQQKTAERFHRKWLRELNAGEHGDVT